MLDIEYNHKLMVAKLAKPGVDILKELAACDIDAWHAATGICTEAGEIMDNIKACVIYNKEPDRPNIIEELGDLEFYMEMLRRAFNVTREETLRANYTKLEKRYKGHIYSDTQAQARADKA